MNRRNLLLPALAAALLGSSLALAQARPEPPAGPPALPEGVPPFEVAQLNPYTWYGRFGFTNCAWIDLGPGVVVIDTGWSATDAANLAAKVKETTGGKPIKWFVMTQLHTDSNGGFEAFLPTDATLFLNARAVHAYGKALAQRAADGGKTPAVVGVSGSTTLVAGSRRLELWAPPGPAHSDFDLVAFSPDSGTVFLGDLVTSARCPLCTDPSADPIGWIAALSRIASWSPTGFVPTRGDASPQADSQITATRDYLSRMVTFLNDQKKKASPEARVAAELALRPTGDYCPAQADNRNALGLYRRLQADGTFVTATVPTDQPAKAAPTPQKQLLFKKD